MYVLKTVPEDFLVYENIALPQAPEATAPHRYLRLRKRGWTTFEAVEAVSNGLRVPRPDVGYAGLKDEDGVTEQYLSVPASALPGGAQDPRITAFNLEQRGSVRFMQLAPAGAGPTPLTIGRLSGNLFRIVVRNLTEAAAESLRTRPGRSNHFFVNYYDTQRFGVPTGPKQTHLLGGALLAGDHDTALDLLRASGSPEAAAALAHTGDSAAFFAGLDPRVRSFYLCAHSSDLWNRELRARLRAVAEGPLDQVRRDGIPYLFPTDRSDVLELLRDSPELAYGKYRWTDGGMRHSTSGRPTVIQAHLSLDGIRPDDTLPGTWRCDLSFFLPSGCYATMAVGQFLHRHVTAADTVRASGLVTAGADAA
jgi:tRNA pseudouridine13 synthase